MAAIGDCGDSLLSPQIQNVNMPQVAIQTPEEQLQSVTLNSPGNDLRPEGVGTRIDIKA